MRLIRKRAFARAGLIGNPSDGYFGRTISLVVRNFWAEVVLYEWDDVELVLSHEENSRFESVHDLVRDVKLHGYYGGIRLVKATIKKFVEYCVRQNIDLHEQKFAVRYQSNIPRQVGLAGSSAIIVATLRALMEFYDVWIPREIQPTLALSVETDELNIAGGLQDRVIQVYEGLVSMDFARERRKLVDGLEYGCYEPLDPALLSNVYLAYDANVSEPTEVVHNNLRQRYQMGDALVLDAMTRFAELAVEARTALVARDSQRLGELLNANFDLRSSIMNIASGQRAIVEAARSVGASAKFAGSGGAIIGLYRDSAMYDALTRRLGEIGCKVIQPRIVE